VVAGTTTGSLSGRENNWSPVGSETTERCNHRGKRFCDKLMEIEINKLSLTDVQSTGWGQCISRRMEPFASWPGCRAHAALSIRVVRAYAPRSMSADRYLQLQLDFYQQPSDEDATSRFS
jgi:hypothetical protein